ncbi:MAG: biopolymer transporter ExbD [Alphaproteobacteria bacterium]|nr:biopolymer transporter ExbD [Alphaproteobacteria bacterium]
MRERYTSDVDSNIGAVPFMSLASLLIPMLLMGAQFVTLGTVESQIPSICAMPCGDDGPHTEPLNLSVLITDQGYTVTGNDEALAEPVRLPCFEGRCRAADDYDTSALTDLLEGVKDRNPEESAVIIVPDSDVSYEVLIHAFDATRGEADALLFPFPTVAGGAQ